MLQKQLINTYKYLKLSCLQYRSDHRTQTHPYAADVCGWETGTSARCKMRSHLCYYDSTTANQINKR